MYFEAETAGGGHI